MLVSDVITAVRRRLGDSVMERWKEETLVLYVSLCQNDICIFTNYHRKQAQLVLVDDQTKYSLPSDCIRVERLEYGGEFLPVESRNTIDANKALYPCALKDNLAWDEIQFVLEYPDSGLFQALSGTYGVLVSSTSNGTSTVDCELVDDYGVLVSASPTNEIDYTYIDVFYSAVPPLATSKDDTLILPDMWMSAFIHYVCGMALQDDNDANNVQRGELEAQKYTRMLQQLFKTSAKDFTTNYKSKLITDQRRV